MIGSIRYRRIVLRVLGIRRVLMLFDLLRGEDGGLLMRVGC
jgi:hypothetical protein